MATSTRILITGNTYPVKDQIKALGGRWDANAKGWSVPADKASAARALVAGAAAPAPRSSDTYSRSTSRPRGTRTGCSCGSVEEYSKSSDCWTCRHDAE